MLDRRALPHAAEVLKARNADLSLEFPAAVMVRRAVADDAALIFLILRADQDSVEMRLLEEEDLRVALVLCVVRVGTEERRRIFLCRSVIVQLDEAGVGAPRPVRVAVIAGVVQIDFSVCRVSGAGVCALVVVDRIRPDADAGVLPVHEVPGNDMIPVLEAVDGTPRAPLVEEVPEIAVADEAVRVVEETGDRLNVKGLPPGRLRNAVMHITDFFGILQDTVAFFFCPGFHLFILLTGSGIAVFIIPAAGLRR